MRVHSLPSLMSTTALVVSLFAVTISPSGVIAQTNPLTESPGKVEPAAPPAQAKEKTTANPSYKPEAEQEQTTAPDATEIIRSLAPLRDGNPNAPRVRDVEVDGGKRRVRVDYSHAIDLTVFFNYDSARLTPQARVQLESLGRALGSRELIAHRFLVAGHTDAVGDAPYNRALSLERAIAVRDHLSEAYGIDPARLVVHGWGYSQLKEPKKPQSAVNRRVEIALLAPARDGSLKDSSLPRAAASGVTVEAEELPVSVTVDRHRTIIVSGDPVTGRVTVIPHGRQDEDDHRWGPLALPTERAVDEWPRYHLADPRWRLSGDALDDFRGTPTPRGHGRRRDVSFYPREMRFSGVYDPVTGHWSDE